MKRTGEGKSSTMRSDVLFVGSWLQDTSPGSLALRGIDPIFCGHQSADEIRAHERKFPQMPGLRTWMTASKSSQTTIWVYVALFCGLVDEGKQEAIHNFTCESARNGVR